ncbi:hypothetical protein V1282_005378 [Nitrobacteraceae bacterium AZCC 2146]
MVIVPFPTTRQAGYVDRIARHIRSMPLQEQRNRYLVSIIHVEYNRQLDAGVDQLLVEADLKAFADAVWVAVRGEQRGGAA